MIFLLLNLKWKVWKDKNKMKHSRSILRITDSRCTGPRMPNCVLSFLLQNLPAMLRTGRREREHRHVGRNGGRGRSRSGRGQRLMLETRPDELSFTRVVVGDMSVAAAVGMFENRKVAFWSWPRRRTQFRVFVRSRLIRDRTQSAPFVFRRLESRPVVRRPTLRLTFPHFASVESVVDVEGETQVGLESVHGERFDSEVVSFNLAEVRGRRLEVAPLRLASVRGRGRREALLASVGSGLEQPPLSTFFDDRNYFVERCWRFFDVWKG